mmetsp:Transcript_4063/g.9138  ORF Transcript_4063/g.9138 Transcript_4063/m.9138 type:complete len:112 (+) Transcript_4063:143-478(+)
MKTVAIVLRILLALAISIVRVEGDGSSSRRRPRQTREEEDKERYQKPFAIILTAVFISVAPVLGRFVHCLMTDPVVPTLWKQLKICGKQIIHEKFGNLGNSSSSMKIGVED